jgi:polysaccharide biosynthesis/export protein
MRNSVKLTTLALLALTNINARSMEMEQYNYKLGPGDRMSIRVVTMDNFSSDVTVLPDGTINAARLGSLYVNKLTIEEAKELLVSEYKKILRRPILHVDLKQARPIRIIVSGGVIRPGIYTLSESQTNSLGDGVNSAGQSVTSQGWPTVVEAIQKAGGVTEESDLENILVTRDGKNGKKRLIQIDYSGVLSAGGNVRNAYVYDGDHVVVGTSQNLSSKKRTLVAKSSLAPSKVEVYVVGEVRRPGATFVSASSPLSVAVNLAGGTNSRATSNIALLRTNAEGIVERTNYKLNAKSSVPGKDNPLLIGGDIVIVDPNAWAKTTDTLKSALEPVGPIINAASIMRLFGL